MSGSTSSKSKTKAKSPEIPIWFALLAVSLGVSAAIIPALVVRIVVDGLALVAITAAGIALAPKLRAHRG
jgi:hypothetical protein